MTTFFGESAEGDCGVEESGERRREASSLDTARFEKNVLLALTSDLPIVPSQKGDSRQFIISWLRLDPGGEFVFSVDFWPDDADDRVPLYGLPPSFSLPAFAPSQQSDASISGLHNTYNFPVVDGDFIRIDGRWNLLDLNPEKESLLLAQSQFLKFVKVFFKNTFPEIDNENNPLDFEKTICALLKNPSEETILLVTLCLKLCDKSARHRLKDELLKICSQVNPALKEHLEQKFLEAHAGADKILE